MISDPTSFFQKLMEQVMIKSPGLAVTLMNQKQGSQEQFLLDLLSERLSKLLTADPDSKPAEPSVVEDLVTEDGIDEQSLLADYEFLVNKNSQLASALGACECWGEDSGCPVCQGEGMPGWTRPETQAYSFFIRPAMKALAS
jgi:hypothetical protein